ncbi:MAG: hypothetical protein LBP92_03430 [Deltaproteobacteria bacterium]|nr:hypothetical protein [Deltaproteobacteria bacterium]
MSAWKTGRKYIGSRPSWKAISSLRDKIHELTAADKGWKNASTVVKEINLVVRGWAALLQRWSRLEGLQADRPIHREPVPPLVRKEAWMED